MKDSDLGIPQRPGLVANGPAPQPAPQPPEQEKRGPGRPAGYTPNKPKESNVGPVSTERLLETKKELESLMMGAGEDKELIDKVSDLQLMVMDLERILITRRKGTGNAR